MTTAPAFLLLLLGHVVGDFYLQSNTMAQNKAENYKWLLIHGAVYSLCIAAILFAGVTFSWYGLFLVLGTSLAHLLIDLLKKHIPTSKKFITDQALHITTIIAFWQLWGNCITLRELTALNGFVSMFGHSLSSITPIILGLLCILKPIGVLIEQGDIWDFNKGESQPQTPSPNQKGAGKMIGYLERIIVFFLLINHQFSAIAFVLTAKSAARFPEINKSDDASSLAEFYIIGTLLSMTSVFIIAFALGLIPS